MNEEVPQFLSLLNKIWPMLVTLVVLILSWARLQSRDNEQGKKIEELEKRVSAGETSGTKIEVALAQIQTDILWIKKALGEK